MPRAWRRPSPTAGRSPPAMPSPGPSHRWCRSSCAGWDARTRRCCFVRAPTGRSGSGACAFCSNASPAASSATAARSPALPCHSRECLRALRAQLGIRYDHLERGILQFATNERDLEALTRHAEATQALGIRRQVKSAGECFALEPALRGLARSRAGRRLQPEATNRAMRIASRWSWRGMLLHGVSCFRFGTRIEAHRGDRRAGQRGAAAERRNRWLRMPTSSRWEATVRCCSRRSGSAFRSIRLKGYSITLPLGPEEAAAAPTVSLTDEAFKIVISRLGNRLRAAGTAELTGYDTTVNPARCAAIADRVRDLFPALGGVSAVDNWSRPAAGDAQQCAGHRQDQAEEPVPEYRTWHARLDLGLRLGKRAGGSDVGAAAAGRLCFHMRQSESEFLQIRGLRYHVRHWRSAGAPKMVLLHGWMDVSASFQFMVDALRATGMSTRRTGAAMA